MVASRQICPQNSFYIPFSEMSRKCHNKNLDMQIFLNFFAENFTTKLQSTPMERTIRKIALTLLSIFAATAAFAQVTTSSISGKITDESGTDLAGATVIAVHVPSGTQSPIASAIVIIAFDISVSGTPAASCSISSL